MLNPQSPLPLYHQLAEILTSAIRSCEFMPGDRIPPETTLAATYGIGRPTARQAVDLLVRKGLVERKRGSGTFVLEQAQPIDLFSLAGTSSAFQKQGVPIEVRIINPVCLATVVDDGENPFNGKEAYIFSRVVLTDEEPVLMEDFFLHRSLFSGIETVDLSLVSLAQTVWERFYLKPVNGRQTFKIVTLCEYRAKLLGIKAKDPVLGVRRSINFPGVESGVFSHIFCRTDKFSFSQTLGGYFND